MSDTEADAMVDDLFERAVERRQRRDEQLKAQGFEPAEAMRRKIELNEAIHRDCRHDRLAAAARALLDAVVWRDGVPDIGCVTQTMIRNLEDALP